MPSRFTLYGAKDFTVADVADMVAAALNIKLSRRESSYKGGDYFLHRDEDGFEVSVEGHVRDEEGNFEEPDFPQYATFVYINHSLPGVEDKLATVQRLDLLRTEVV
ncbi:hypothetical protein OG840_01755 [Streptomyces sp. NBC_01764]|uniref:hypothetical protein n=1 Tax=unclassified Streptomyces TaxID=2593676 RepID=UPI002252BD98|nr:MULTISPECIES: hypothetical protein [unclassified Streptomyces]MCX4400557.1 hypothetical protein [Streptomyces sp. NBC_01764]MCX5090431.1 hypothetical protein [Streptomyces sp. NBC_00365]